MRLSFSFVILCGLFWLVACGGDDDPMPGSDATTGNPDSRTTTPDAGGGADAGVDSGGGSDAGGGSATFTAVYGVISASCAPCHTSSANGNLSMGDKATAYSNLVGIDAAGPSCGSSGLKRVVAGDASSSLLYQKVAGTQTCGSRMPLSRDPLTGAEIDLIEQWIDDGAADD